MRPLQRLREVIRITKNAAGNGICVDKEQIPRAVAFIKRAKEAAEEFNTSLSAYATASLRQAADGSDFIAIVRAETGVDIQVISGDEEAVYTFNGIIAGLPPELKSRNILCIDSGGGSTELISGVAGTVHKHKSFALGAVRLTERFFPGFFLTKENIAQCLKFIDAEIKPALNNFLRNKPAVFIATGGTASSIAYMAKGKSNNHLIDYSNYEVAIDTFQAIAERVLSGASPTERKSIDGLEEKRADIIPAGILIYKAIFNTIQPSSFIYSPYSLKEGLVLSEAV